MKSFYTYPTIDKEKAAAFLRTRRYAQPMTQAATDSLAKTLETLSKNLEGGAVTPGQSVLGFGMGSASGRIRSIMIGRLPSQKMLNITPENRVKYTDLRQNYRIAKSIVNALNRGNARTILRRARNAILQQDGSYITIKRALTAASFTDKQRDKRKRRLQAKYGSDSNKDQISKQILQNLQEAHRKQAEFLPRRAEAIANKIVDKTSSLGTNPWSSKPAALDRMRALRTKHAAAISAIRLTSSTMVGEQIIRAKQYRTPTQIQEDDQSEVAQVTSNNVNQRKVHNIDGFQYTDPSRGLTAQETTYATQLAQGMALIYQKRLNNQPISQEEVADYAKAKQEMLKIGVETVNL